MKKTIPLIIASAITTGGMVNLMADEATDSLTHQQHLYKWRIILHKIDGDGDKLISLDEFLAARTLKAEKRFDFIDADDSGTITLEEAQAAVPPRDFDPDELRACVADKLGIELPDKRPLAEIFAQVDADANGVVDWQEYLNVKLEFATQRFNRMDASADGYLDGTEVRESFKKRFILHQAIRDCREEMRVVNDLIDD